MIKDFDRKLVGPASVGIRIASLYELSGPVDLKRGRMPKQQRLKLPHTLRPGERVVAESHEVFEIPSNMAILLVHNSTAMRIGLHIQGGFGEPGYRGVLYYSILNASKSAVVLDADLSLAKVVLIPVEGRTVPLISQFQGGRLL